MYLIKCKFCVSHFTVRNLSSTTSMCPATLFRFSGLKMWCQNADLFVKNFRKFQKFTVSSISQPRPQTSFKKLALTPHDCAGKFCLI